LVRGSFGRLLARLLVATMQQRRRLLLLFVSPCGCCKRLKLLLLLALVHFAYFNELSKASVAQKVKEILVFKESQLDDLQGFVIVEYIVVFSVVTLLVSRFAVRSVNSLLIIELRTQNAYLSF
jgi:hypothetical protein